MSNDKMAMTDSTFGDKSQWSLLPTVAQPNVATEDHLQSLGLDVNDGLPKFKLNEPGPAALASSIFQQNNMITDDDSEQSFVVLGKTSFESIRESSMASYMAIREKSILTDHNSLISMMSPSEIEDNLKKVLEENLKLKETLKQNNTAIKLQFNTITKWQKEVMTVCDNHKQKFQETKELISRLKKENDDLREKIAKNQLQELSQSVEHDTLTYECNSFPSLHTTMSEKDMLEECFAVEKALPSELIESNGGCVEKGLPFKLLESNGGCVVKGLPFKLLESNGGCVVKGLPFKLLESNGGCVEKGLPFKLLESPKSNEKDTLTKSNGKDVVTGGCNFNDTSNIFPSDLSTPNIHIGAIRDHIGLEVERAAKLTKSNISSSENMSSVNFDDSLKEGKKLQDAQDKLKNEHDLLKKVDELSGELSKVKINYSTTKEVLQELENRYHTDIEMFSQQLQKANKELDSCKEKSNSTNSLELQKLVSNCCEKDMRLKYLEEIITSLESQIRKFEENAFPLIDLQIEPSQEISGDRQLVKEKIEFYNAKLADLSKCFASQCSRYLRIQECLKESACIIQAFENSHLLPNDIITEEKVKNYKEKLCEYRRTLITEQLQSIDDKQATVKTQQQFQKILSDYNSVICELEILKDENSKLTTMQAKAEEENSQKWAEIKKQLNEEKRILEKEKTELLEASLNNQIDKKEIVEEKRKIENERDSLVFERERLHEERIHLFEERTSLDRQSKLYEAEEGTLQKEKKILQKKCEYLNCEIGELKHELEEAELTIRQLQADNNKLQENEELITVYKIQTEEREKEFEDMRTIHKNLQDQLQALSMANLQLRSENDRLGGQERQESNSGEAIDRQFVNVLVCPKCTNGFDAGSITAHLQQCMNSH